MIFLLEARKVRILYTIPFQINLVVKNETGFSFNNGMCLVVKQQHRKVKSTSKLLNKFRCQITF